jgi:hypothetical protein
MLTAIQVPSYNISAPMLITVNPSRLRFVGWLPQNVGTEGAFVFNDAATLAGANSSNQIMAIPYDAASIGNIGDSALNWPCTNGLVVSQVPTGGVIAVVYEFYVQS